MGIDMGFYGPNGAAYLIKVYKRANNLWPLFQCKSSGMEMGFYRPKIATFYIIMELIAGRLIGIGI